MDYEGEIRRHLKAARAIASKAESDERALTPEERSKIEGELGEAAKLRKQQEGEQEDAALRERMDQLDAEAGDDDEGAIDGKRAAALNAKALQGTRTGLVPWGKSLGQQLTEHPTFRRFMAQYPNGVPESAKGISLPPIPMAGGLKATAPPVTGGYPGGVGNVFPVPGIPSDAPTAATGAGLVRPDWQPMIPPIFGPPLTLRQLVTVGNTTSDLIEYARMHEEYVPDAAKPWKLKGENAGMVPEAQTTALPKDPNAPTAAELSAGGYKPQSQLSFERAVAPVRTIAHWLAATRRALSDAAQVRTLIDSFLRDGLQRELEEQMLNGDGKGENLHGILDQATAFAPAAPSGIIAGTRQALTRVQRLGGTVTALLMSPEVDEKLDLMRDDVGRFFGQGPFGAGPATLWGRPRVISYAMPADTVLLGDFRTCVLWDREQATLTVTDSHSDFFIRNLIAILGELRCAFGILRPNWLVKVTGDIDELPPVRTTTVPATPGPAPTVDDITPKQGKANTPVTITGTNLAPPLSVSFRPKGGSDRGNDLSMDKPQVGGDGKSVTGKVPTGGTAGAYEVHVKSGRHEHKTKSEFTYQAGT